MLKEDFGDGKDEIGIRVFSCLLFAAEKHFDTSVFLILEEFNEILALLDDILLEYLIDEGLKLGLILAFDNNSHQQIINSLALLVISGVELHEYSFIADNLQELLELLLPLVTVEHESK
jgi:hypothetical protein